MGPVAPGDDRRPSSDVQPELVNAGKACIELTQRVRYWAWPIFDRHLATLYDVSRDSDGVGG